MNGADFLALVGFMKATFVSIFACLDGVTIVEADGYKLTCLTAALVAMALVIAVNAYKKLTE